MFRRHYLQCKRKIKKTREGMKKNESRGGRRWLIRPDYGAVLVIILMMAMNQRATVVLTLKTVQAAWQEARSLKERAPPRTRSHPASCETVGWPRPHGNLPWRPSIDVRVAPANYG